MKPENHPGAARTKEALSAVAVTEEENIEDREDLATAREEEEAPEGRKPWWKSLGPGLITGAADDDPSGVGTYSVTGGSVRLFAIVADSRLPSHDDRRSGDVRPRRRRHGQGSRGGHKAVLSEVAALRLRAAADSRERNEHLC